MAAAVQLPGGQPGPVQYLAVEDRVLYVLHGTARRRFDKTMCIDQQILLRERDAGFGE